VSKEVEAQKVDVGKYRAQGILMAVGYAAAMYILIKIGDMKVKIESLEYSRTSLRERINELEERATTLENFMSTLPPNKP